MIFLVNSNQIDTKNVTYRSLGFGEKLASGGEGFSLEFLIDEVADDLGKKVNSFIEQCRVDDEGRSVVDIPELKELGYPSFENLIVVSPALLGELICDYLYFELFDSIFNGMSNKSFVVNSIRSVDVLGLKVRITGEGFFNK